MKRLSVLIALALCLTIGGAYAAWTFATDGVADAKVADISIGMNVQESGAMGTLSAEFTGYDYEVVPNDENKPILANNATDAKLVITFVAAANAEASVKANGIAVKASLDVTTAFTSGNETEVITAVTDNGVTINAGSWTGRTENDDGTVTFTYEISSDEIMTWFQINDAEAITDLETANTYKDAVEAGKMTITVSANVG